MAADDLAVQTACRLLGVSESGYYAWKTRSPSARQLRHAWLAELCRQVHTDSRGTYGHRRVHAELTLGRGLTVGTNQVELVMRRAGIRGLTGRPTYKRVANLATAADLVNRHFATEQPDRLWVTDIERHEALSNLAVVKGHRLPFVAADGLKLRAA